MIWFTDRESLFLVWPSGDFEFEAVIQGQVLAQEPSSIAAGPFVKTLLATQLEKLSPIGGQMVWGAESGLQEAHLQKRSFVLGKKLHRLLGHFLTGHDLLFFLVEVHQIEKVVLGGLVVF